MATNHPRMSVLGKDKNLYAAEVRNRAEQAKLEVKLAQLEREKQRELRLMDIERQKFRSKFSKLSKQASEVTMYETHYPGFYYTRSGEQRNLPKDDESTCSLHFEDVRSLIFTKDEVDLEKIICLHLLCVHRTESLTPPKKKARCMCREHSPCERLIERSKKGFTNFERLSKLLPLYTIELIGHDKAMGERPHPPINDGRLASRILINETVMALINTVVTALEKANTDKFKQLLFMGNSPVEMRKILGTAHIAEFTDFLLNHQLLNCCDTYVLTPPFKIKVQYLDVKTSQGILEHFVNNLRQNVLQQPTRPVEQDQKEVDKEYKLSKTAVIMMPRPTMERKKSSEVSVSSSKGPAKLEGKKHKRSTEDRVVVRRTKINFIARNKEDAAKTKRIEYDLEEDDWDFIPKKRSSTSSGKTRMKVIEPIIPIKNATLPVLDEKESNEEKFLESVESNKSNEMESDSPSGEHKPKRIPIWERRESKNHIKQTTCPACMERWKTPLPTPKTPTVRKSNVLPEMYSNSLRTNSQHRISMMINKAMYKLESYDRRYSPENENSRRASSKQEVEDDATDNVYLNPMDLAKIEQEIKERETKKKLEKFFERYSNNNKK